MKESVKGRRGEQGQQRQSQQRQGFLRHQAESSLASRSWPPSLASLTRYLFCVSTLQQPRASSPVASSTTSSCWVTSTSSTPPSSPTRWLWYAGLSRLELT